MEGVEDLVSSELVVVQPGLDVPQMQSRLDDLGGRIKRAVSDLSSRYPEVKESYDRVRRKLAREAEIGAVEGSPYEVQTALFDMDLKRCEVISKGLDEKARRIFGAVMSGDYSGIGGEHFFARKIAEYVADPDFFRRELNGVAWNLYRKERHEGENFELLIEMIVERFLGEFLEDRSLIDQAYGVAREALSFERADFFWTLEGLDDGKKVQAVFDEDWHRCMEFLESLDDDFERRLFYGYVTNLRNDLGGGLDFCLQLSYLKEGPALAVSLFMIVRNGPLKNHERLSGMTEEELRDLCVDLIDRFVVYFPENRLELRSIEKRFMEESQKAMRRALKKGKMLRASY